MIRRLAILAVLSVAALALAASASAEAVPRSYTLYDVGTFGGTLSVAYAVNNSGQVTGIARTSSDSNRAFSWTIGDGLTDVGLIAGGGWAGGYGINEQGHIAGQGGTSNGYGAFLWDGTSMNHVSSASRYADGQGVNDGDQVAGSADPTSTGLWHPIRWEADGSYVDLGTLGGLRGYGLDINDKGQVVGYSETCQACGPIPRSRGFVWDPLLGMIELPSLGGSFSAGRAINDKGVIAGRGDLGSDCGLGCMRPVVWAEGQTFDLGGLVPGGDGEARGLNELGHVVGTARRSDGRYGAFVWTGGQMRDLNTMIDAPGWHLTTAYDINDWGWIVGEATNPAGQRRGFVLGPNAWVEEGQTFGEGDGTHAEDPTNRRGDPVNTATGRFSTSATDLSLPGIGIPFELTRTYTSGDASTGPLGPGWTYPYAASLSFDADGNAVLRAENGQQVTFTCAPDGTFAGAPGARSRLEAVPSGGYELVRRDRVRYRFDDAGRLTGLRDANDQGLTLAYGADGRLATVTDSVGREIAFVHDAAGFLTSVRLPDGRDVAYGYTGERLTSVADARGGTVRYTYDAGGRMTTIVDQNGDTLVRNAYGADGRVVEQFDARGQRSTYAWDAAAQTATYTDPTGAVWTDVYRDNVLVRSVDPLGNATTYRYDADVHLTAVTDAAGNVTTMRYDGRGNLIARTGPLSWVERFEYDADDNLVKSVDGRGNATTYEYDADGNLVRMTEPGGAVSSAAYDARGLLTSTTDALGQTTRYEYDSSGNLVAVVAPSGATTTMAYDASGRRTSLVEPRGNVPGANPSEYVTTFAYDAADAVIRTTDPLGNVTRLAYDAAGNVVLGTDALGRETTYAYDAAGGLVAVTAPDGTKTTYAYDPAGRPTERTDANGRTTRYGFDAAGRVQEIVSPGGRRTAYEYDARGLPVKLVGPAGTTTFAHDALGRLTGISYGDGAPAVTYAYDASGNRTSMTDGAGTATYTYDEQNRLTGVARAGSAGFAYTYDAAGRLTRVVYPDSTAVDYAYDGDGRMSSVSSGGAVSTYAYDVAGNLVETRLPAANGTVETRAYDRAGRLQQVLSERAGATLARFTYARDPVGNPVTITGTDGTATYGYDSLDRLTSECLAASCLRYDYDAVGNRTAEQRPEGTTTYTYDEADRLVSQTGPAGTVSYTYDANGNLAADGTRTFRYDLADRLVSATSGRKTTTYAYDGDGRRLQAATGHNVTNFLWDVNAAVALLALEQNGSDRLIRRYVVGLDVVSMATRSDTSYFHYDGLGSVTNVTSSAGAPLWAYQYEPFGTSRTETKSSRKAPDNPLRFAGEYVDGETGLYHLRARQYDASTGRFLSIDPVAQPRDEPGFAPYVYAGDRPTVLTDPSGLCPACVAAGFGAAWEGGWYSLKTAFGPDDFTLRGLGASMVGGAVSSGGGKLVGRYVEKLGLSGARKLLSKVGVTAGSSTAGALAKQGVCGRLASLRELAVANASGLAASSISPAYEPAHGFLPYKLRSLFDFSKPNTKLFWGELMGKKVIGTSVGAIASPSSRPCK